MPRRRWSNRLCLMVALLFAAAPALAEPVLIKVGTLGRVQGWLFGAPGDGACWVALPIHEFGSGGPPDSFVYTDGRGQSGEARPVLTIKRIAAALEATGGQDDLAFARVSTPSQNCLSGLGLDTYAYAAIVGQRPRLVLTDLLPTSARVVEATVTRTVVDEVKGKMIGIWPTIPTDAHVMKKGISGAVATIQRSSNIHPFGMILRVREDKQLGVALRFDAIREAFFHVEQDWLQTERLRRNSEDGASFDIVSFDALTFDFSVGPSVLRDEQGCWVVAARGGASTVGLIIANHSRFDRLETLTVSASSDCAPPAETFFLEHRAGTDGSWTYLGQCPVQSDRIGQKADCRVGLKGLQQLRLRFPTGGGKIAISQVRLSGVVSEE